MTPTLVFDIETIPDCAGLRAINGWQGEDAEIAQRAFAARREKTGSEFMPHHLHRVCAIACVFRDKDGLRVRSIGEADDGEVKLIQQFYRTIDAHTPQLVSWNGGGFDLPVLNYRALIHGLSAARYWDWGDDDRDFKWNNYLNRYHTRHLDLMDVLAQFSGRANAPLDDMAKLSGFPGKLGMDGSKVWDAYHAGRIGEIRAYCETDVMNTWLVYCRFLLMRGVFSRDTYAEEIALARSTITALAEQPDGAHWKEYLQAWR